MSANKKRYPHPKNRVILSAIIAALSTTLALTLLLYDAALLGYYLFSTLIVAIITFFFKERFYPHLIAEADTADDAKHSPWKALVTVFLIFIALIGFPLILAGFVSGPIWFMMITSFISGANIAELGIYVQSTK